MRFKNFASVILCTAILLFACPAMLLAEVIVYAEHQIVSSQETDLGIETTLRLYLSNEGPESLTAVMIEVVDPLLFGTSDEIANLSIYELLVHEEVVVDWTVLNHGLFLESRPLVFRGTGIGAGGATVDFPIVSHLFD